MSLYDLLVEPFRYEFMQRGLLSAVTLGVSGGVLGCFLVLRRLALMGDALAHSLLPGIGLAYLAFGTSLPALFFGALVAGLLTALGSATLSRLTRVKEDAAFGALFIALFGAGVVIVNLSGTPLNLMHFLFGNILGVSPSDLRLASATSATTLAVVILFYRHLLLETFDPAFYRATGGTGGVIHMGLLTLTVLNLIAALQTMGIVLALGLFLLPAVTAFLWCERLPGMLICSACLAAAGSLVGILLSYHAGWPSGACIVICLGVAFLGSAIGSPKYGLVSRLRRPRTE